MKRKVSVFVLLGFVVSLFSLTTLALAEEQEAQLWLIWDILVKPSQVMEFEKAMQDQVAMYKKHEFPYPWSAASTMDNHYYFLIPIKNFADIDDVYKAFSEAEKKLGAEYKAIEKGFVGTMDHIRPSLWYLNQELSYFPENPRLKPDEAGYIFYSYLYFKPGMEAEAVAVCKEWKALYKGKGVPDSYLMWIGDIGTDMPVFCVVQSGKTGSDFYAQAEKRQKEMGDEAMKLWAKTAKICRKVDRKIGTPRPDLSIIAFADRE